MYISRQKFFCAGVTLLLPHRLHFTVTTRNTTRDKMTVVTYALLRSPLVVDLECHPLLELHGLILCKLLSREKGGTVQGLCEYL